MDLETAKLVAFALWAESYEGATGKEPNVIRGMFGEMQGAECEEDLYRVLGEDLAFKLINYDTVWAAKVEEPPPPTEREEVEAGEDLAREPDPDIPHPYTKSYGDGSPRGFCRCGEPKYAAIHILPEVEDTTQPAEDKPPEKKKRK